MIKIEQGVPVPPTAYARKGTSKYPLQTMMPGDSFFIPTDNVVRTQRAVCSAAARQGVKVTMRRREEEVDGVLVTGVRVWRKE